MLLKCLERALQVLYPWQWRTKDSNGQVTACVERCCARHHRHSEVWPWPGSDTARRTSLARRPRPGDLQAGSDSSPVSERPLTTVPVGSLRPCRQCWSAASAFHQLSTACSTSLPAQHLRPSGFFSCRPHSLELSRISSGTRPSVWTVSDGCLKRICSLDTSAFSALEVLTTTAYINFLTYLLLK